MRAIIFDTETTGLLMPSSAPLESQPRIIELGAIIVEDGEKVEEHNWLINPGNLPLPPKITKITGIKDEDLVDKPNFFNVAGDVADAFNRCDLTICHNAPFDVGMLKNELKRIGFDMFPWPPETICTVQEYKHLLGRNQNLSDLYEAVMGKKFLDAHRASDDANALFELLKEDGFFEFISGDL